MSTLIKAKEAFEIASSKRNEKCIEYISEGILSAAEKGEYSFDYIGTPIPANIFKRLQILGYKVSFKAELTRVYNKGCYNISWER